MKKFTLFLVAMLFSALSFAELNPYAYGLSSELSLDESTLTVNYSLNADAIGVNIVILDDETVVETITCDGKTKGSYTVEVPTTDFPKSTSLTWKVEVLGNSVATPTKQTTTFSFYLPYSMDVDVDTESDYFGRWYVIEATDGGKGKSGYHSTSVGRGLYAFDAALEPIKNNSGTYGFTGGMTLGATETNAAGDYINLSCVTTSGGRVFVGRFRSGYAPILEATDLHSNDYPLVLRSGGGRAIALDARGRGENLQLVMLDTDFNIKEYDLGTAEEWTTVATPSRTFNKTGLIIDRNDAAITYDNEGGLWINQHSASNPTIAHLSTSGLDYDNITAGLSHILGEAKYNIRGAAINQEGTELAVPAAGRGKVAVFTISKDYEGKISLTPKYTVTTGNNNTALSYDYADNLYIANRSAETISFYAMPYDGEVTTPAPSKYAFELTEVVPEVYTVTVEKVGEGTIEGSGEYLENSTVTLKATPAEHYEFTGWTGDVTSNENPLTITVNSDMTITANFQEQTKYIITASAADNTMGYVTGGGTYYAGETVTLTAVAKSTYYFVNWSDGNTNATRTFNATENVTLTANFAKANPRAWAYDLKMVEEGDNYKFSFTATTAANATLLFLDKEGNELYAAHNIGAVAAGANTVSIEKAYFTQVKDVYWSVKMDGEAITAVAEITDQSRGIYDFYNMMGVVVDNDPNSEYFGKIYIQQSYEYPGSGSTAARNKTQKAGIFIYDQGLNELNPENEGYKPTMPAGYTAIGKSRESFKRLAIDPSNGNLVFGNNIAGEGSVWSIGRDNLTAEATNIIEGATGIDKVNAICYDENGSLYVLANIVTGVTPYKLYKFTDGVQTELTLAGKKIFIDADVAMTSDGRGGLWIAQRRGGITQYSILSHINVAEDKVDFVLDAEGTYKDWFTGNCFRAAIAYNAAESIVAVQGASKILLFKVSYDALTGAPSISKYLQVSPVGSSVDGLAFDYAGDLYTVNSGSEKFQKFTLPTADNICTVPAPKSQAIVKEIRHTVTTNTTGNGTIIGAGEYVAGETATLTASPAAHHQFVNWTFADATTSTDNPLELVVNSDITVTAHFEPIQYTVVALTNDESKGTVTGAGTYDYGTEATLTATPEPGYKLLYWSDRSTENPRTITMTKNEAISAYFVKEYAVEPTFTIEKVWENTNVPASTNNGYQAVGWDGKIYLKDRGNDVINVYSDATTSATYASTDSKDDQSIAVDDAGNLVLRSGSTYFYDAPKQVILYKKGETTYKTIDFTLPASGRCDFISASGDLFSAEGGCVYFYCQDQTTVSRLHVKNGGATAGDIVIDAVGAGITGGNSQSHVMVDIFGNLVTHSRTAAINKTINAYTGEATTFTLPNDQKAIALGGCSFELGGKEFWAYNVKGSNICNTEWNLYNMTDKKYLSNEILYVENNTDKNSAANWLNVQVVDENTAYIYQFCPTVAMAVWKVSLVRNDLENFTITATANNALMGSIVGSGEYKEGTIATLTATPNAGFRFVNWTKEGVEVSTDATYLFTVTEDVELVANFEVILLDTEHNEGILDYLNDQTVDVAVYRSLTAGMYNTLCLPFDVDDILGTPLENTTVWQYNGAEVKGEGDSKEIFLEFTEVDTIVAGQPYLVEPTEDIEAPMEFKGVTISATEGSAVEQFAAVTMQGVLHPTELQADDKSILFLVANNELAWANVTANMNGMRAYFKVNEPSLQSARTRAYIRKEPTVATDMENITTSETEIKKVIYNGTLYIIRGDEVYTIQGTKVK